MPGQDTTAAVHRQHVLEALLHTASLRRAGVPFLQELVSELGRTLNAHLVFVGELSLDARRVRTRAVWRGGAMGDDFTYGLHGTPCQRVLDEAPLVVSDGVAEAYPDDEALRVMGLRSYAGIPLLDDQGRSIGLLVVADTQPMAQGEAVRDALTLLGDRLATELERERDQARRARSEAFLDAVFETEHLGVALVTRSGRALSVNGQLGVLLGVDRAALLDHAWTRFFVSPTPSEALQQWAAAVEAGGVRMEAQLRHADGAILPAHVTVQWHRGDGEAPFGVVFLRDLSAQRQAEARIQSLAFEDRLTGLANRSLFLDRLEAAVRRRQRDPSEGFAVHFVDIDHFRDVNDGLGHPAGDGLLVAVANRLSERVRASDTLARIGGDEFAVLQLGVEVPEHAVALAEQLLAVVRAPCAVAGRQMRPSVSVGVATAIEDAHSATTLMEQADMALFQAKERRGRYALHSASLDRAVRDRIELGDALRRALDAPDQLSVAFQPVVTLDKRKVVGAEALCRWTHPTLGPVRPDRFIAVAEDRGLITALGARVLEAACQHVARWRQHAPDMWVSVNASPLEFAAPTFVDQVRAALAKAGLPGEALIIEITESVLAHDVVAVNERMRTLRADGVRFAIDDFGTGFSSLLYLKTLPVAALKVAQEFVRDMLTDPGDAEIVRATLSLARAFDLQVIAEGVEERGQAAELWGAGCRLAQGYRFARPMPPEGIDALVIKGDPLASASALPAVKITSRPG